ncbi:MAG: hypothetical protein KF727_14130 [Microbacteriaceae bacterium]|nr:hypothetical protein [Microbacteriaceae bacterium]
MADSTHLEPTPLRWRRARLSAAALIAAAALVIAPFTAPSAAAASYGPGYDNADNGGNGHIGAYRFGGNNVYCLEAAAPRPTGATSSSGYQAWPTMSADNNARVNWAISTFGQSTDPNWTSAVAMYVWSLADPVEYNSHGMSGDSWYIGRVPWSQRSTVLGYLAQIRAGAGAITAGATTGSGAMTFGILTTDNYDGTLSVVLSPSSATGTIVLTNGIFDTTGSNTISGVGDGAVLDITGIPPADGSEYKISAVGDFSTTGAVYAGNVQVLTTGSAQRLAGPGESAPVSIHLEAEDPIFRATDFVPVLTSAVDMKYLDGTQPFTDTFTFDVALNPESGLINSWTQDGSGRYYPVTATVTVYQTTSPVVAGGPIPADATVFETLTVTTSAADGPTVPYTVSTTAIPSASAYYVAVSEIRAEDQTIQTQLFIPTDYVWTDGWGVAAETAILPATGTTVATSDQVQGFPVIDTAYLDGLIFDGAQIRFTAHLRPTWDVLESEDPDAIDPNAVCEAGNVAHQVTVDAGAEVNTGEITSLAPGVYDWVIELLDDAGTVIWTAPCGVVAERSIITQLEVITLASDGPSGAAVQDVAAITGTINDGDVLTFAAYQATHDDAGEPVCEAANLVWESEPIALEPGVVDGLEVPSGYAELDYGTYWWIETINDTTGDVVWTGVCGLDNETSRVTRAALSSTGYDASSGQPLLIAGIVALTLGAAAVGITAAVRRRKDRRYQS